MELTEDQFVQSYQEELQAAHSMAAPQIMVINQDTAFAVPVQVRVIQLDEFTREIQDHATPQRTSPRR